MSEKSSLTIIVPLHNEEDSLGELNRRLAAVLDKLDLRWELILVDDGSTDRTQEIARELSSVDERVRMIALSRNFGHQAAITAGLDFADGDGVVIMDGDLQHPPELIPDLVAHWRDGYDVVYAVREDRHGEPWTKRVTARVFYRLLGALSSTKIPAYVGDFRLVDRRALQTFRSMREQNRYLRGMFSWIGFRQIGVPCPPVERYGGTSKYTLGKMLSLAIDGLVSFSNVPLRLALHAGFILSTVSFAGGIVAGALKFAGVYAVPGWASIVVVVSFLGGAQLLILGVIGTYIGRIYDEVKGRPLYVIGDAQGFDRDLDELRADSRAMGVE